MSTYPPTKSTDSNSSKYAAARAVSNSRKFDHITPILKSLHWLKIRQRIQYKIISLTYNVLQTNQPTYLNSLLSIQSSTRTRSSDVVTLLRPTNPSRLKITDRSFQIHAPALWNSLSPTLRQSSLSNPSHAPISLSPAQFHSK